jgi:hypothetical protein
LSTSSLNKGKELQKDLPFQDPITSGAGAIIEIQGEKMACSAPETIPYATAHIMTPVSL